VDTHDWLHTKENDIDDDDVQTNFSQTNLSNWLKLWGQNSSPIDYSNNDLDGNQNEYTSHQERCCSFGSTQG
jgi:hypothetical protein